MGGGGGHCWCPARHTGNHQHSLLMVTALSGSLGPHSPPGGRSSSGYRSEALRGQGCAQGHAAASPRSPSVPSPHRYATPPADPCLRLSKLTGQGFRWVQGERRRLLEASFAQTPPAWAPTFPRAFAGWGWGCGLSSPHPSSEAMPFSPDFLLSS